MTTVNTLAKLKEHGMVLAGHCGHKDCGHARLLKLDVLIDWLGPDYVFVNEKRIAAAFKCEDESHRGGTIRVVADTRPPHMNPYLKAKGG